MIISETHVSCFPKSSQLGSVDSIVLLQTPLEMESELFLRFFPLLWGSGSVSKLTSSSTLADEGKNIHPQLTDVQIIPSSLNCSVLE